MWPPGDRVRGAVPAVVAAALAVIVVGPALAPGYVLRYDMVFLPRPALTPDLLGLGSQTPRAVPSDVVVALAAHVLPGQLVQKLVLLAIVALAGIGAARLIPGSTTGQVAAAVAYAWTPYLAERLLIGQWAVLIGYAALPWGVRAAMRLGRTGRGVPAYVGVLAAASLGGGAAWVIVAPAALLTLLVSGRSAGRRELIRRAGLGLGVLVVLALPWAVPALTRPGGVPADTSAARVFAPGADTPLGVIGSLLTGGGIWSGQAVPGGRDSVVAVIGGVLLLAVSLLGWVIGRRAGLLPVAAAGGLGLALSLAAAVTPLADLIARLPGGGLLRDGQRSLAPWCLLVAVGIGLAVPWLARRLRTRAVAALALLPVAVLPALGWGVAGRLVPVAYPRDLTAVTRLVDGDPRPGAVLLLPFQPYRQYDWNGHRTSLDPLARAIDRTVVASSDLPVLVGGRTVVVPGEDHLAAAAARALAGPDPADALGQLGIRWVVQDDPAPSSGPDLAGATTRFTGRDVTLLELSTVDARTAAAPARPYRPPVLPVLLGDAAWCVLVALAGLAALERIARSARVRLLPFGNRKTG